MQTYEGSVTSCPGTDIVAMPTLWHQPGNNILTISALGAPHFQIGDKPIVFARRKTAALLLYLAVTRRRHARDVLANLLWGDMPQQSAAANLRKALAELRMRIDGVVVPTRHVIAMNPDYPIVFDVSAFESAVEDGTATKNPHLLAHAVNGYADDFLSGFNLIMADAFDEWAGLYRQYLREQLLGALEMLVTIHMRRGEYRVALKSARRIVALDPWREEGHRHLMQLFAAHGDRAAAVAQYHVCRRTLAEELGIAPTAETVALYEQLLAGGAELGDGFRADTASSRGAGGSNHAQLRSQPHAIGNLHGNGDLYLALHRRKQSSRPDSSGEK